MDKIGNLLKQKRLELGFTIEDVSEKTRLTHKHIKALEEGDISFFHDDLSYLRFFIKSYCEVVGVDFEDIKDELRTNIDDYTMSFTTSTLRAHEEIEQGIAHHSEELASKKSQTQATTQPKRTKVKQNPKKQIRKPDISLVSLVTIIVLIAFALMFAFVIFLKSDKKADVPAPEKQPIASTQDDKDKDKDTPETPEKEETPAKEISVTKLDVTNYTIDNVKDGDVLDFEVYFGGSNSGFSMSVDGKVLDEPKSAVYNYQTYARGKVTAKKDMKISLYVGYMVDVSMKINGKTVKIDDSIVKSGASNTLEFTVKGE